MKAQKLYFTSAILLTSIVLAGTASATTYVVKPDATGDFPTIQAAIDDPGVLDGDIIELTDGTFTGDGNRDVDYRGKAVTVRSQSGNPAICIIDCEGSAGNRHRGFLFQSGEDPAARLEDVTVTDGWVEGGFPDHSGGAVLCLGSSPTIHGCTFHNNTAFTSGSGGAIFGRGSSPTIRDCIFRENSAQSAGGAISCEDHLLPVIIEDCVCLSNTSVAGGAIAIQYGEAVISECVITGNASGSGAGVLAESAEISFFNCTVSGNYASLWGGGLWVFYSHVIMENSILWGNCSATQGDDAYMHHPNTSLTFICSVLDQSKIYTGGPGELILDGPQVEEDPLFCDPQPCTDAPTEEGDYSLCADSPCLPENSPDDCGLIGPLGEGCGPCAPTATVSTTWGQIKAIYAN